MELHISAEMLEKTRLFAVQAAEDEIVYHGSFPSDDVAACLDLPLDPLKFRLQQACPQCCRQSHHLRWIKYSSPASRWERGDGFAGALSLCDPCGLQVQFLSLQQR